MYFTTCQCGIAVYMYLSLSLYCIVVTGACLVSRAWLGLQYTITCYKYNHMVMYHVHHGN